MFEVNNETTVCTSKEIKITQGYKEEFQGTNNFLSSSFWGIIPRFIFVQKNKILEALGIKYGILEGEL